MSESPPVLKDLRWACRRNESDNRRLVKEFFYRQRPKAEKFIAYFQTFMNTGAPVETLRALYDGALAEEDDTPCIGIIPGEVKRSLYGSCLLISSGLSISCSRIHLLSINSVFWP